MSNLSFYLDMDDQNLNDKFKKIFENITATKVLKKGEYVYAQGDLANSFFYVKEGTIRVFFNSPDGLEKTVILASRGDVIGEAAFFDGEPRVSSAVAVETSMVCCLGKAELKSLISNYPDLALEIMKIQAKRIRLLSGQLDDLVFLPADIRIARLFLQEIHNKGSHKISLTHEEIGNHVGVSRITVSKILSKFAKDGIILTNYRFILVKDIDRLKFIARFED